MSASMMLQLLVVSMMLTMMFRFPKGPSRSMVYIFVAQTNNDFLGTWTLWHGFKLILIVVNQQQEQ